MKIGIITFHCAHNYGAVLQAYASKFFLESLGHDVYFIDYRPRFLTHKYKVFNLYRFFSFSISKTIKKISYELPLLCDRRLKYIKFEKFINNYLLCDGLRSCKTIEDYKKLDCIYLGSDQIWNTDLVGTDISFYLGDLGLDVPVFSYGASLESNISIKYKDIFTKSLKRMVAVSVREIESQRLLKEDVDIDSEFVVDPTLLLTNEQWSNIIEPMDVDKPYVLFYYFGHDMNTINSAEIFAKKNGCELFIVSVGVYKDKRYINNISPENFLWLIKNASYVLTNSYHGTVFSIIFDKPFYTLKKKGSNIRIYNLCDLSGYKDRIIDSIDTDLEWKELSYPNVNLSNSIKKSKQFINQTIIRINENIR